MRILIRFDDIAENMNWHLMAKCEKIFDELNIKPVMGVIPNNQDKDLLVYPKKENFWQIVKKWQLKGWEIAMHGYNHIYDNDTNKKDFFEYGGKSEFYGHSLNSQSKKIKKGLEIFKKNDIKIRTFFSPNHTYDFNTFKALKLSGINEVIDGYGLKPYLENNIKFIPQLFYKVFTLPFGIQTTQIHLNYWKQKEFEDFERFIVTNSKKIITYNQALEKVNDNIFYTFINLITKKIMQTKRLLRK